VAWCGECKAALSHDVTTEDGSAELCGSENSLLQNKFHNSQILVEEEGHEETGADEEVIEDEEDEAEDPEEEEPADPEVGDTSLSEMNASKYPKEYLGRKDLCFMLLPPGKGHKCSPPMIDTYPQYCPYKKEAINSLAVRWLQDYFVMKDDASGNSCTKGKFEGTGIKMRCAAFLNGDTGRVRACGNGVECANGKCTEKKTLQDMWNQAVPNRRCEGNEVGKTDGTTSAMDCKLQCEQISGCTGFNKIKQGADKGKCSFFSTYTCTRLNCECNQDRSANIYTIYKKGAGHHSNHHR